MHTMKMLTTSSTMIKPTVGALIVMCALATYVDATMLTIDNYFELTKNKSVFIKFFAPWCGHCQAMQGDWDQLMAKYNDSTDFLIAEVDCTESGEELCEKYGVQGYPSLKYGDPYNLEDYDGDRDYEALNDFVEEQLTPQCDPNNLDLCDEESKEFVKKIQDMGYWKLEAMINEKLQDIEETIEDYQEEMMEIEETMRDALEFKEETIADIKSDGPLSLMKSVLGLMKKPDIPTEEKEETESQNETQANAETKDEL